MLYQGDCDAGVRELAAALGWQYELERLCAQAGAGEPVGWRGEGGTRGGPRAQDVRAGECFTTHRKRINVPCSSNGEKERNQAAHIVRYCCAVLPP